jgi:hypothetical protein
MYYMWINKNLVHQVGDQTKVMLRCTVNQPSRFGLRCFWIYVFRGRWLWESQRFLTIRHVVTWLLWYECDVVRGILALKKGIWMQSALHYAFLNVRAFYPPNNEFRWNLVLESANVGCFLYVECNPYFTWKSNWSLLFIVKLAYCKQ